jgi:hypothetical protein
MVPAPEVHGGRPGEASKCREVETFGNRHGTPALCDGVEDLQRHDQAGLAGIAAWPLFDRDGHILALRFGQDELGNRVMVAGGPDAPLSPDVGEEWPLMAAASLDGAGGLEEP